jgi:hypothetical protein
VHRILPPYMSVYFLEENTFTYTYTSKDTQSDTWTKTYTSKDTKSDTWSNTYTSKDTQSDTWTNIYTSVDTQEITGTDTDTWKVLHPNTSRDTAPSQNFSHHRHRALHIAMFSHWQLSVIGNVSLKLIEITFTDTAWEKQYTVCSLDVHYTGYPPRCLCLHCMFSICVYSCVSVTDHVYLYTLQTYMLG